MAEGQVQPATTEVKPGWKTSEFWIQLLFAGLGLGMLSGYITPSETNEISNAVSQVASLIPTVLYIISRWKTKTGGGAVDTQALLSTLSAIAQSQVQTPPPSTNNNQG